MLTLRNFLNVYCEIDSRWELNGCYERLIVFLIYIACRCCHHRDHRASKRWKVRTPYRPATAIRESFLSHVCPRNATYAPLCYFHARRRAHINCSRSPKLYLLLVSMIAKSFESTLVSKLSRPYDLTGDM